jgi:hypothetical protein
MTIVEAVAEATNRSETELPALQHSIDTDALDALLTRPHSTTAISFEYADTTIWISGDGGLEVQVSE